LSARRLAVLIRQLPATSRTHAATPDRWGTVEHALTHVADVLSLIRIEQLRVAGAKNTPKFQPLPRPGDAVKRPYTAQENARARSMLPGLENPHTPPTTPLEVPT
jgi:hypothetical protein